MNNAHSSSVVLSILTWILAISMGIPILGTAQVHPSTKPVSHIHQLKQGVLIFGAPDQRKKIEFLQMHLSSDQISPKERERTEELLMQTKLERDSFYRALCSAVQTHYTFSEYVVTQAHLMGSVKDSILITWQDQGRQAEIFFVRRGSVESGADALIITDVNGKVLSRPFPYYVRTTKISALFEAFFGSADITWKDLNIVIEKLDKKLHVHHTKVNRRSTRF
ncbi:MAG: hypothetical protein HKN87_23695 [Saprospiraceae bacterium]|nr:hypothetical protein [Saprospiraceae bacterium]